MIQDFTAEFNDTNSDFSGIRNIGSESQELVEYHKQDVIRIWYNDQTVGFESHWHTALEIILPVENWYDVTAADKAYHLQPGDIFFIPSGCLHSLTAPPEKGFRFIFLLDLTPFVTLNSFLKIESLLKDPLQINKDSCPQIYDAAYRLLQQVLNEYSEQREFTELRIISLYMNLFVLLGDNYFNNRPLFPGVQDTKRKEYIQKFRHVMDYIDTHYTEDLSMDEMADATGFSKFHFARLFKEYTGYTFSSYVMHRRILAAEELLAKPDLSITQIAMQAGFGSLSTFNRVFRKEKNCPPTEFRSMIQNNSHWPR